MGKQLYDIRNYPRNAGTSQPGRYNDQLMGEKVSIIEHNIADYIVFAQKLSAYLKYYNEKNEPAGSWQNFLRDDVSYHLAVIAADKPVHWENAWRELTENIEGTGATAQKENKKYFTWRFDFLYSLTGRLIDASIYSKQFVPWQNDLKALYTTANLDIIYDLLQKYNEAAKDLFIDDDKAFTYKDMTLNKRSSININIEIYKEQLTDILFTGNSVATDGKFIFAGGNDVIEEINAATEYLNDLAEQLLRIYTRVHEIAEMHLKQSLVSFDQHQPHVGLFYTFLLLLDDHKKEINSLLLKHLEYYYKQVLNVKAKPYQPSKAYVTFELAKNVNEYLIKTGSLLSAGKDATSKEIYFRTQQDIIVNKTVPGEIRSFTIIKNENDKQNERVKAGEPLGIFACSQADSSDGNGKPLQPGQSWYPFRITSGNANTDTQIGTSFYSALIIETPPVDNKFQLLIKFKSTGGLNNLKNFVDDYCTLKILTEKDPLVCTLDNSSFVNNQRLLTIDFTIPAKTKIKKQEPNVSILFGRKSQQVINEDFFSNINALQAADVETFSIRLMAQSIPVAKAETVLGMTDLSASFPAFGGVPKSGSWFRIIEPILKGRAISNLDVIIEWASTTERQFNIGVDYENAGEKNYTIPNDKEKSTLNIIGNTPVIFNSDQIKIILREDLGHLTYAEDIAKAGKGKHKISLRGKPSLTQLDKKLASLQTEMAKMMKQGNNTIGDFDILQLAIKELQDKIDEAKKEPFPDPPYTPIIKSINLLCSVTESISFKDIYNQYPHGYKKTDAGKFDLVPATPFEGELYLGFSKLQQLQSLNVLVQVEEGTADPTLPNPEVNWAFLHKNTWLNFDASQFKDGTRGLIQSGIVSFVSPGYDCTQNTLLPAGQFWIRAAIRFNESNAVCKIFSINTQAVLAQFSDNGNAEASLGNNLPANSITQLFPKQASVKKVLQPYASFGGRLEEESKNLYTRTSERLRHKSRGVTAWDYEHIIAEAFAEIYKVKVLNHACLKTKNNQTQIVSKAGEMIILVTGKTAAQSSVYKPLVSKSKLTEISEFIDQLNSPFAKAHIMNPMFEEVKVDTIVTFSADIKDESFYEKKLEADIKRFLSPWAFEDGAEPEFGGVIYRAALLDFIEELPYIDFVEKLEIRHQHSVTGDIAAASSPASVLISAPSHIIDGKLRSASQTNSLINSPEFAC